MKRIEDQPWADFAERLSKELIEHGATEAVIVTRQENEDRIATNYFNCNFEKRCILVGHILEDIVMEIIENNRDWINRILEDGDVDG